MQQPTHRVHQSGHARSVRRALVRCTHEQRMQLREILGHECLGRDDIRLSAGAPTLSVRHAPAKLGALSDAREEGSRQPDRSTMLRARAMPTARDYCLLPSHRQLGGCLAVAQHMVAQLLLEI